jgi:hypothetical protein
LNGDGKTTMDTDGFTRPGLSYLLIAVPWFVVSAVEGFPTGGPSVVGIAIALPISILLLAFISWRQIRILKARSLKSGRYFERKARYALPPEYHDSEDALLAAKRS